MSGIVVVLGGLQVDEVLRVADLPRPDQTVVVREHRRTPAGGALRQALEVARHRTPVRVVGCVGDDDAGQRICRALADAAVDTAFVRRDAEQATSKVVVTVDGSGRRTRAVVPGASAGAVFPSAALDGAGVLLATTDLPLPVVAVGLRAAKAAGAMTILVAAPAVALSDDDVASADVLVARERDAQRFGALTYRGTALLLRDRGEILVLRPAHDDVLLDAPAPPGAGTELTAVLCGWLAAAASAGQRLEAILGLEP